MPVLAVAAVVVAQHDLVAVRAAPSGGDDASPGHRLDGGAGGHREVDAGVVAAGPRGTTGPVAGADVRRDGRGVAGLGRGGPRLGRGPGLGGGLGGRFGRGPGDRLGRRPGAGLRGGLGARRGRGPGALSTGFAAGLVAGCAAGRVLGTCAEVFAGGFVAEGAFAGGAVGTCASGVAGFRGATMRRVRRWPGWMRSGSSPTTARLVSYRPFQPPRTRSSRAIFDRESPGVTVYISRTVGTAVGPTFLVGRSGKARCPGREAVLTAFPPGDFARAFAVPPGVTSGASPPRSRPARAPQDGQAPGPWPLRTRSAIAICWSLEARSARGA